MLKKTADLVYEPMRLIREGLTKKAESIVFYRTGGMGGGGSGSKLSPESRHCSVILSALTEKY